MTRVLLLVTAYRWLAAMLATAPLAVVLAGPVRFHPRGDAVLFEPGGTWLLEAGRQAGPMMGGVLATGGLVSLLLMLGWSLPLGALVAVGQGSRGGDAWAEASRRWTTLVLYQGAAMLLSTLIVLGLGALGSPPQTHRFAQLVRPAVVMALAFALVWALTVVLDAARMRRFTDRDGPLSALYEGGAMLARRKGLWFAAVWRTALAVVVTLGALVVVHAMATVGAPGAALFLVHAVAVLAYVGLRTSWFTQLAEAARAEIAPADTPSGDE